MAFFFTLKRRLLLKQILLNKTIEVQVDRLRVKRVNFINHLLVFVEGKFEHVWSYRKLISRIHYNFQM